MHANTFFRLAGHTRVRSLYQILLIPLLVSRLGVQAQLIPFVSDTDGMEESDTLYFAFGSNLSPTQMHARCPNSTPIGLAHLPHPWQWLINARGYANIVNDQLTTKDSISATSGPPSDETNLGQHGDDGGDGPGVYGILYTLPPEDEKILDMYEGVPHAYEKVSLPVIMTNPLTPGDGKAGKKGKEVSALVYVDFKRTEPREAKEEYVLRMNRAIHEAREAYGLPEDYIDQVMRPFIPDGGWEGAGIAPE